ncbi:MAG: MotA/TolQ/ExbB proton channel family protein [Gemmataceae bacterium]
MEAAASRNTLLLRLVMAVACGWVLLGPPGAFSVPAAMGQEATEETADADKAAPSMSKGGHGFGEILRHMLKSVGWLFGIVLLAISISLVTLVVLLVMELRMDAAVPPAFVEEFTDTVNQRQFRQAYDLAREDQSFVARVLTAGMARLQYGIEDAREASFSMLESVKAGKEQLIVYLATIGTLGPLLGLVGTVFGMILSFMTLSSGSQINAQQLADDISHALVITLLGIGLSVPAIFCHAFFKNRLIRITHDAGTVADDLLTQMYYNSRKSGSAPATAEPTEAPRPAVPPPTPPIKQK